MSVDLPDPDGPMIAAKRPAGKSTVTPGQRVDGRLALAVALAQRVSGDDRVAVVLRGGRGSLLSGCGIA